MKKKKNRMFLSEEDSGFVELYFSAEEIEGLIEILTFSENVANSASASAKTREEKSLIPKFQKMSSIAGYLLEKIILDSDPGKPDGFYN